MTQQRSTMDKLTAVPVEVQFGGETFWLRPLSIKKCRAFKNRLVGVVRQAVLFMGAAMDDPAPGGTAFSELPVAEQVGQMLSLVETFFDDELVELGKLALPEVAAKGDEWIEDNVTAGELQLVLAEAIKINFPMLAGLTQTLRLGSPAGMSSMRGST